MLYMHIKVIFIYINALKKKEVGMSILNWNEITQFKLVKLRFFRYSNYCNFFNLTPKMCIFFFCMQSNICLYY